MKEFRSLPKKLITVEVPVDLATEVRGMASHAEYRPLNAVVTELFCVALGRNPRVYGIEPSLRARRNKGAVANA